MQQRVEVAKEGKEVETEGRWKSTALQGAKEEI